MALKTQLEAIYDLPIFAAARATDPPTSKAAAAQAVDLAADHRRRILVALEAGPAGQTEIAARAGLDKHQANKRFSEMRRAGLIEKTGRTVRNPGGRNEDEYRLTNAV